MAIILMLKNLMAVPSHSMASLLLNLNLSAFDIDSNEVDVWTILLISLLKRRQ